MTEEAGLEFRLRKIDEIKNYILDELNHSDLMSEKYKKTCQYLNYVQHLLILASAITDWASISTIQFRSLVCVPFGITSSPIGLTVSTITEGIKKYNSIIKKTRICEARKPARF